MNCLYVIGEHGTQLCKVGITGPPVEIRLQTLQTGNPRRLVVLRTYPGLGVRHIEAQVHHALSSYRVRSDGEWFALDSPAQVDEVVAQLGIKRPWLWQFNLGGLIKELFVMIINAVLFGNQQNKRKSAKLGKTYR